MMNRYIHFIIIGIAGLLAYANTFDVPFQYDDILVIKENPVIKDLKYYVSPSEAEVFKHHFGYHTFRSRYIGYLTLALNYRYHGLDVTGYHVVNLLIHIGTALFVYLLVLLSFKTDVLRTSEIRGHAGHIAFFSALLFVTHPLQTEAVTYIWQRVASLAGMFYVLSLTAYIKWRISLSAVSKSGAQKLFHIKTFPIYLLCIAAAVLSMKTKQTALTIPFTIAVYEFMFFHGETRKRAMYLIPLFLTLPIIPLTLIDIGKPIGDLIGDVGRATRDLTEMSRTDYLFTQFTVIVQYIRLIIFPYKQNVNHAYTIYHSLFDFRVLSSFIFLLSLFGLGVYLMYRSRHISHVRLAAFGIVWFFITLSVESSFIPIAEIICEYRMYLPSTGLFITLVSFIFFAMNKIKHRFGKIESSVIIALSVISLILAGATYARNSVWESRFSLWQDSVQKNPGNARGLTSLGHAYYAEKRDDKKAVELYSRAISIDPEYDLAYYDRGVIYAKHNYVNEAIEDFTKAISLSPGSVPYYHNRAGVYVRSGQYDKAIADYTKEIDINPRSTIGYADRGFVYMKVNRYDLAVRDFTSAINLDPGYVQAYMRRGFAYSSMGNVERAVPDLKKACQMGNSFSCAALPSD